MAGHRREINALHEIVVIHKDVELSFFLVGEKKISEGFFICIRFFSCPYFKVYSFFCEGF